MNSLLYRGGRCRIMTRGAMGELWVGGLFQRVRAGSFRASSGLGAARLVTLEYVVTFSACGWSSMLLG